jgi:LemA protein
MGTLWIVIVAAGVVVAVAIVAFNRLVGMRQLTRNAWSDVDVYLKRRAELIPNLVSSVQAYAKHEQGTLVATAEARTALTSAQGSLAQRAEAEHNLGERIGQVLMLAESYPDLKAQDNFLELQRSLSETEKLIASARQYYNACVRDYNTLIEAFPSSILAGVGGFKAAEFFQVDDAWQREAPQVKGVP